MSVRLPIDHLGELWPRDLRGVRLGALLHPASVSATFEHSLSVLERHHGDLFHLIALFGPQHGFLGQTQDNMIEWRGFRHERLGIPVHSLYGEHREPTPEMLEQLDALVIDLQDVGTRFYTFIWTLYLAMRACERAGVKVVVLDRPNPINGLATEGPMLDLAYRSFMGMHPIPIRHGRTIGELAEQFQREAFPTLDVRVLPMQGWDRAMWFDQTGLPWVLPSPNMPTLDTAIVYSGMCLLEATNLSEGRGTTRPFELFGAPWIHAEEFAREMNAQRLPGAHFRPASFEPTFQKHARTLCHGAQLHVTDREAFLPFHTGVQILHHIRKRYGGDFEWKQPPYEYEYERLPIEILLGGPVASLFPD